MREFLKPGNHCLSIYDIEIGWWTIIFQRGGRGRLVIFVLACYFIKRWEGSWDRGVGACLSKKLPARKVLCRAIGFGLRRCSIVSVSWVIQCPCVFLIAFLCGCFQSFVHARFYKIRGSMVLRKLVCALMHWGWLILRMGSQMKCIRQFVSSNKLFYRGLYSVAAGIFLF